MELIAVLDSFDLGIAAMEKQGGVEKGVYMIRTQLEDALRRRGLERIAVSAGEPFNPSVAEAVAESESERAPGCIVEEIERGYTLHGKVLRPARVKISKGQIKQ
jgi:molecular chaperone GrpE